MMELVQQRKNADTKEERYDLFSSLLDPNDEDAEVTLTDSELLGTSPIAERSQCTDYLDTGNIFIFLLAGRHS